MPKSFVAMPRIDSASVNPSARLAAEARREIDDAADVRHPAGVQHLAVKADTESGTSWRDCWRFCAVTTTSSRPTISGAASSAAAGGVSCCACAANGHDNAAATAMRTAALLRLFIWHSPMAPAAPIFGPEYPPKRTQSKPSIIDTSVSKVRSTSLRSIMSGGDIAIVSPVVRIRSPALNAATSAS